MKTITNSVTPQTATYRRILQSEAPLERPFSQVVAQRQNQRPDENERPVDMRSKVDGSMNRAVKPLEGSDRQPSQNDSKSETDRTPVDGFGSSKVTRNPVNQEDAKQISADAKSTEPVTKVKVPEAGAKDDTQTGAQEEQTIEDELTEELVKVAKDEISMQVPGALFLLPETNQVMPLVDGNLSSDAQTTQVSQVGNSEGVSSKAVEGQATIQIQDLEILTGQKLEVALSTDFKVALENASQPPTQVIESMDAKSQPDSVKMPALTVETGAAQSLASDVSIVKSLETQLATKTQVQFSQMMAAYGVTEAQVQVSNSAAEEVNVVKSLEVAVSEESADEPVKISSEGVSLVTSTQESSKDSGRGDRARDDSDAKSQINATKSTVTSSVETADRFQGLLQVDKNDAVTSIKETLKTPISPAAILDQIKEAMVKQPLKIGEHSEMIIKLKPEELGKVELKIEVHKDSVIAKFEVASQMVKETIESNLSDLRNSLKDKGFGDMSFDVNVAKEKNQGQQQGSGQSKRGRRSPGGIAQLEKLETQYQKSLASLVGNSQFEHYA